MSIIATIVFIVVFWFTEAIRFRFAISQVPVFVAMWNHYNSYYKCLVVE